MSATQRETQVSETTQKNASKTGTMSSGSSSGFSAGSGQPRIGALLQARREELGWDIDEVAEHLKIKPAYLRALEEDAYDQLPERVYAVGFLKSYAGLLGLDAAGLAISFARDAMALRAAPKTPPLSFPTAPTERRIPVSLLILVGVAAVAGAYGVWYRYAGQTLPPVSPALLQSAPGGAPGLPTTPADVPRSLTGSKLAENASPQTGALPNVPYVPSQGSVGSASGGNVGQTASDMFGKSQNPAPNSGSSSASAAPSSGEGASSSTIASPTAAPIQASPFMPAPDPVPNAQDPVTESASGDPAYSELAGASQGVKLYATKASWVQVKDRDGKIVFSQTLNNGDSWLGDPENAPYSITVGNAGGVVLQSGKVTSQPLGPNGQVKRGISVTPQAVREGKFGLAVSPPDAASAPTLDHGSEAQ